MKTVVCLLVLLLGYCCISWACSLDSLEKNFLGAVDEGNPRYSAPVPFGQIRIEYNHYRWDTSPKRAGFWKARDPIEARCIIHDFDTFESHPPEVVYKSSGTFPRYRQEIIKGGCADLKMNCQD